MAATLPQNPATDPQRWASLPNADLLRAWAEHNTLKSVVRDMTYRSLTAGTESK